MFFKRGKIGGVRATEAAAGALESDRAGTVTLDGSVQLPNGTDTEARS